ncbi:hypothetical protein GOODEAATRI_012836 [Goodea atripinnis]|uniref:Uncharacterized protein n=1 Tax=Goodea atripinnis TaxID=208336 RepID=A0ABV0NB57_9TELE
MARASSYNALASSSWPLSSARRPRCRSTEWELGKRELASAMQNWASLSRLSAMKSSPAGKRDGTEVQRDRSDISDSAASKRDTASDGGLWDPNTGGRGQEKTTFTSKDHGTIIYKEGRLRWMEGFLTTGLTSDLSAIGILLLSSVSL